MSTLGKLLCKHDAGSLLETLALFLHMIHVHATDVLPLVVYQGYPLYAEVPA